MTEVSSIKTKSVGGRKGQFSLPYRAAQNLILESEAGSQFTEHQRAELPAIVSHWLQSPEDPPILLEASFGKKWRKILLEHCSVVVGESSAVKSATPVHFDFGGLPFPPTEKPKFTFIDLFAGIGGFRIALQQLGGKCVFSSEWDRHAKETYCQNYGEVPFGDITQLSNGVILTKQFDVLAGGFPCQPFSRAGVSARESLGQEHGFECPTQGQLFFDILNIAKIHRPKVLFLENVGNLMRHDGGHTFRVIREAITGDLGYHFFSAVYNTNPLVPQSRVRCMIVAWKDAPDIQWQMPELKGEPLPLKSILESMSPDNPYTLTERLWEGHIRRSNRNIARGTGFTAHVKDINKPSTTLVARYYKDGKECLIPQENHPKKIPRMLTLRECARLQGFPETFTPHKSKVAAYKQFGNAVPVPLVNHVGASIISYL
ncbi:MAG: DNA cytosine methyltransferase [Verrucomicrobiota bacterium]